MEKGLSFKKMDLHVHTPASKCFLNKKITPEEFVKAALDAGMKAIAITDHNTGEWIDKTKEAASNTDLIVFPGVEITVSEGFHILALFDVDKGKDHVVWLLGALDILPEMQGKPDAVCNKGAHDVINKITEREGLAILAHIDSPKGAFNETTGAVRTHLFNDENYCAVETISGELPPGLDGSKGFHWMPPCYQASDNPDSTNPIKHSSEGIGTKFTYFKVDRTINQEGLRQCFSDPEVRIRGMDALTQEAYSRILSLNVTDGFLKDQNILFHDGLNSIIGGKGVGKSLIVEFLRFVLDQPSTNESILKDYNGKLDSCLGLSSTVAILVQLSSGTKLKITRTYGGEVECVDEETNEEYHGNISELFPILVYSQTEVIKIAENPDAQLELIDNFIDTRPYLTLFREIGEKLKTNDTKLAESINAKTDLAEFQKKFDTLSGQIAEKNKLLGSMEMDKIFTEYKSMEEKRDNLAIAKEYFQKVKKTLTESKKKVIASEPTSPEDSTDKELSAIFQSATDTRAKLISNMEGFEKKLDEGYEAAERIIVSWLPEFEAKKAEYDEALKEKEGKKEIEAERIKLVEEKNRVQAKIDEIKDIASALNDLEEERKSLLDQLEKAHDDYFQCRESMFNTLTELSREKLQLHLSHSTNRKQYAKKLTTLLKGSNVRQAVIKTITDNLMPRNLVGLVIKRNEDELAKQADITTENAQKVIDKLHSEGEFSRVLALEHKCYPDDTPEILFKKEHGDYAPLNKLSVGQKCTALLIIALSEGTRPVIIDQPEDALDITTVWEDISSKLRETKEQRQFILTTHNASVAVSSDSDMFIVVRSTANRANVKCLGAIEVPDVKKAVIQHLEGGNEPYGLRHKKYNIQLPK